MPGLFDLLDSDEARFGIQLLAAGGYTPERFGTGQRIASAMQGFQAQRDGDMRRQMLKSQIEENNAQTAARQLQAQRDQAINGVIMNRFGRNGSAVGTGGVAPSGSGPGASGATPAVAMGSGVPPAMGGTPASGVAQPSGFPLSMDDIAILGTAGAKSADMLFNMYKYANDGVKREAGNYYKDPITGTVTYLPKLDNGMTVDVAGNVIEAPNFARTSALIKGAEASATTRATEAAKYPFTVGADRERQTTQAALDTVPVVGADNNTYYQPRLAVATGSGGSGGAPGQGGGFMAGRNPITQSSATQLNDNWVKNAYQPTLDAGKAASDVSANIQALRNIDVNTGWGAETKASAAAVLEGLGIAPANAKLFAANSQKFQSIAMDKLMTTLSAQKGMQTEGDADRAKQTFVSLKNTPEANAFIMDFAQAKANQDQRKAQFYEAALPLAQKAGDLTRVDREWRKIQGSIWSDPILQRWSK